MARLSTIQENLKRKLMSEGARAATLSPGDPKRKTFDDLVERAHTRDLLLVINHCIAYERISEAVKKLLKYVLAALPLRAGGVRDCFEFVVAVHPSTRAPESGSSNGTSIGRRGPGITPEALQLAARLMYTTPSFVTPLEWFTGIAPQLLSLLDGVDGEKELANVAAYMIGTILGPERYGKPGAEGFTALALPILENIAKSQPRATSGGAPNILIDSASLAQALKRLETLTNSHPTPSLTKRLLRFIRLPLWLIASWSPSSEQLEEDYLKPAKRLLQTYLKLENPTQAYPALERIVNNLRSTGQDWKYILSETGGLQAVESQNLPSLVNSPGSEIDLNAVEHSIGFLIAVLSDTADVQGIPDLFLALLRKRMSSAGAAIHTKSSAEDFESKYIEFKLIQEMLGKMPEKLVCNSSQILEFVYEFLDLFVKSLEKGKADQEALDQATTLLSILHTVLASQRSKTASFQAANSGIISKIEPLLIAITQSNEISDTDSSSRIPEVARNLLHFLWVAQDQQETSKSTPSPSQDRYAEDIMQRDLAVSYLTDIDAPPPVTAEGLSLLSSLIKASSPVLSIPATLHLVVMKLQSPEDYIYLSTISTLTELSLHDTRTVVSTLLEKYADVDETQDLDTRLRTGEALTKIIEYKSKNGGSGFGVNLVGELSTTLLHIASLRTTKPKTTRALEKEKRLRELREKKDRAEAAAAWGGTVPDMSDLIISKEEQTHTSTLQAIIDSWATSGTRNVEDTRIRASALSIFCAALATYLTLFQSKVIEVAVDLSLMILKLEREDGAAILRRSAILLILGLLRSLDKASEERRKVPFVFSGDSLKQIGELLGYIAATDGDGLVRQHARDVKVSLGNWREREVALGMGLRFRGEDGAIQMVTEGLGELRGLSVRPELSADGCDGGSWRNKVVIEEIV